MVVPVDTSHKYTDVFTNDYVGSGLAHHFYEIREKDEELVLMRIGFQDGPIKDRKSVV